MTDDDFFMKILGPSPINVSATTLTSDMHVDKITRVPSGGYALDVRLIEKKHTTAKMRRETLMLVDGAFKKWPRGNAWADLRGDLSRAALAYIKEHTL